MLQLDIYHTQEGRYINDILDNGEVLAEMDKETSMIDLSVLEGREGTEMIVRHYNLVDGKPVFDYGADKVLGKVGKNENGLYFIEY